MHIVLANKWYPPHSGYGGVAMYNYYLSRELVRIGHTVTVISSRQSDEAPVYEEVDGVKVYRLMTRHRSWLHRLPFLGQYMRSIIQLIYSARVAMFIRRLQRLQPLDIVEFAEIGAEGYVYLHFPSHSKTVVRCHTPTVLLNKHYPGEVPYSTVITEKMERFCIRHADLLTTPSHDMANKISKLFEVPREDIVAIPNPIDTEEFASAERPDRSRPKDDFIILHVGRLERVKGIDVLAQAIPAVLKHVPKARFVFIGAARSDDQSRYWRQQIETAGTDHVTFLGFVTQQELAKWYQRADVAVVPSMNYESFSYTCAQAMAAGVPVVASDIGGIGETLDHGRCGLLIPPGDAKELSKSIIYLLQHPRRRMELSRNGYTRARDIFDVIKISRQMSDIYSQLIGYDHQM